MSGDAPTTHLLHRMNAVFSVQLNCAGGGVEDVSHGIRRWCVRRCLSSNYPLLITAIIVSAAASLSDSEYENCTGIVTSLADAICDLDNNKKLCEYDGGDCCPSTCTSTEDAECSTDTRECINPDAPDYPYAEFENCRGTWRYINDSICDQVNNNADCGYDGGDCCLSTCVSSLLCSEDNSDCIDPSAEDFNFIEYENCTGYMPDAGNGRCNDDNNNAECGYDWGDCCECTCVPDAFNCVAGFNCVDPDVADLNDTCGQVKPCSVNTKQQWVVRDTAGASELARSINCSGGTFNVEWIEHVIVTEMIWVTDLTILNITGSGDQGRAIADGNGTSRIFLVKNATLHLENIQLTRGSAASAGALFIDYGNVTFSGEVIVTNSTSTLYSGGAIRVINDGNIYSNGNLTIANNTGAWHGAAIHCDSSSVTLLGTTAFVSNTVDTLGTADGIGFGGAIFANRNSKIFWSGQTTFLDNVVVGGVASRVIFCYGGAVAAVSGSSVSWTSATFFVGNEACYGGGALYANDSGAFNWTAETIFSNNIADDSGGAVLLESTSTASWSGKTTFQGNKATIGGAFDIVGGPTVSWTADTFFYGNNAKTYGGAMYLSGSSVLECSGGTIMEGNSASEGGVLYVGDGPTVTWNCPVSFCHNVAEFQGGAIYVVANTLTAVETDFSFSAPTKFFNNSGGTYGGALMVSGDMNFALESEDIEFERNWAGSTGGAVLFTGVGTAPTFRASKFIANEAQIGGAVYATGTGTVISATGESSPLTFDKCNFTGNLAASTGGAVESAAGNDYFVNTSFVDNVATQGGALRLAGTASIIDCRFERNLAAENGGPAISDVGYTEDMSSCYFEDNDFSCDSGFFLHFEEGTRYPVVCLGCSECEDCTIDGNTTYPTCEEAFEHTTSSGVGITLETLNVSEGYWRATPVSWDILECYNQDACLGGITDSAEFCATGYEGPYCAVCSSGYAESLSYTCRKCSDDNLVAWLVLSSAAVLVLTFLWFMVSKENDTSRCGLFRILTKFPTQPIKIIIVAWQILTELTSVANISFPTAYEIFLDGADLLNFDVGWILSAGCFIDMDFHGRLITCTVGPLVAMGVLAITYRIALCRNRTERSIEKVRGKHVSMALWITFLVYSSVSSTVFHMFSCEDLADGERYLLADYSILCRSSKHRILQIYAAFMILVYPVGIPLVYAAILFFGRDALRISRAPDTKRPSVKAALQLSSPYRPGCFYYEVVECARRVTLTGGIVFVLPNEMEQVAVALLLAVMFALWAEALAPYRSPWDTWIYRIGHVVVILSIFVAFLAFYTDGAESGNGSNEKYGKALVAGNVCWVVAVVVEGLTTAFSDTIMAEHLPRSVSSAVVGFCDDFGDRTTNSTVSRNPNADEDCGGEADRVFERPRFRVSKAFPIPMPGYVSPRDSDSVVL